VGVGGNVMPPIDGIGIVELAVPEDEERG
jgi:hypothetical protein